MLDIEKEAAKLIAEQTEIKTVLTIPEQRPNEFISVELVGQSGSRFARRCMLTVQAWADTRQRAVKIANEASRAAYFLDIHPNIFAPEVSNFYRFPDPDSKQERYQMTVEFSVCE